MAVDSSVMACVRVVVNIPAEMTTASSAAESGEMIKQVELELPQSMSVGDLIRPVTVALTKHLEANGQDTKWLTGTGLRFRLAHPVNLTPLDEEKTLVEEGVVTGNQLFLVKHSFDKPFVPLEDNVAHGVASVEARKWGNADSRKLSVALLATAFPALALAGAIAGGGTSPIRYGVLGIASLATVVLLSVGSTLIRSDEVEYRALGKVVAAGAYPAAACAAWTAIPRSPGIYHVLTVLAVLTACAVLFRVIVREPSWLHHAMLVPSGVATMVAAFSLWKPQAPAALGAQIAVAELAVLILLAHKLALTFAQIRNAPVPALGEPLVNKTRDSFDIVEAARSSTQVALSSIISQAARTRECHRIRYGLVAGLSAYVVLGQGAIGYFNRQGGWSAWIMALLISCVLYIRGSSDKHWASSGTQMFAAVLGWIVFLVAVPLSPQYDVAYDSLSKQVAAGVGILVGLLVFSTIWAVQHRSLLSQTMLWVIQNVEVVVITLCATDLFLFSGLIGAIRHR